MRSVRKMMVYGRPSGVHLQLQRTKLRVEVCNFNHNVEVDRLDGRWRMQLFPQKCIQTQRNLAEEGDAGKGEIQMKKTQRFEVREA